MLKDNCPVCVANPIESLCNAEYMRKYPARNTVRFGAISINICDQHLKELYDDLTQYLHQVEDR